MSEQRCETCRIWCQPHHSEPQHLEDGQEYFVSDCLRYPPTVMDSDDSYRGINPLTASFQWCGEWQAKEPQTKDQALYALARLTLAGDLEAARALADRVQELE